MSKDDEPTPPEKTPLGKAIQTFVKKAVLAIFIWSAVAAYFYVGLGLAMSTHMRTAQNAGIAMLCFGSLAIVGFAIRRWYKAHVAQPESALSKPGPSETKADTVGQQLNLRAWQIAVILGLLIALTKFGYFRSSKSRMLDQLARHGVSPQEITGYRTRDFWNDVAVPLFEFQFAETNHDSFEPSDLENQASLRLSEIRAKLEASRIALVDSDLRALVQKHLEAESDTLFSFKLLLRETVSDSQPGVSSQVELNRSQTMLDALMIKYLEDPTSVPEEARGIVELSLKHAVDSDKRFDEMQNMRVRLEERYPGVEFSLPKSIPLE